jgi:inosine-uridine nucleoside N-ribohydrolase
VPIPVILDTDIWTDIDDALALAMIHALEDRGELKLQAVTISTDHRWCAPYVDLVNTYYGRPHVPIGIVKDGLDIESIRKRLPDWYLPVTRFTDHLAQRKNDDGALTYPHRLTSDSAIPEATTLLRETLAAQPDESVVIIQIGYSTNLARLLRSPPDSISALDGRQLVAKKARSLVVMAGSFRQPADGKQNPEFNLLVDVPSAQALFAHCPTPIVASGVEVGLALRYPPESIERDYAYVENHPIAQSYRLFFDERKAKCPPLTSTVHAHATFDLTAVLYAARPDRNYFSLSNPGRISVLDDGSSRFEEVPGGRDRYLIVSDEQAARTLEAMVMLASQPPAHRA